MKLQILKGNFAVCKLESTQNINFDQPLTFLSKTDEEISLVCKEESIPQNPISADCGWSGFRLAGSQQFSQIGIIAKISTALALENIAIFVISTFNTDYVFVKTQNFHRGIEIMQEIGYKLVV